MFEAIPSAVTKELMPHLEVPVIGIGAGPDTDGQVLVFHDLLGIRDGLGPRFVKRYANIQQEMDAGVQRLRRGRAHRPLPGAGARLFDRRGRVGGAAHAACLSSEEPLVTIA